MEEREKEIMVHKEILTSELKSAEEERHKVAVELQVRKNKVKNLKIKYEGLISVYIYILYIIYNIYIYI